jgi:hypothetical protein
MDGHIGSLSMGMQANAHVGLLDDKLALVGEVEPCQIEWNQDPGSWDVLFLTNHDLDTNGKLVSFVGVMYAEGDEVMPWFVLPLMGHPVAAVHVLVGPDF